MGTNALEAKVAGSAQVIAPVLVNQQIEAFEPVVWVATVPVALDGQRVDVSLTQADVDHVFRELMPPELRLREFEFSLIELPTGEWALTLRDAVGDARVVGEDNIWAVANQMADDVEKHRLDEFLDLSRPDEQDTDEAV